MRKTPFSHTRFLNVPGIMEYSEEHLNFFRICDITANIITGGLRTVFKQEWDTRYKASLGEWKDTLKNGQDFEGLEPPASKKRNAKLLNIMMNGNSKEWDCTALFFGILFSCSIGKFLSAVIHSHVDDLRVFRNEIFAHVSKGTISDTDFKTLIGRVEVAFLGLSLPVDDIKAIANQKSFPTKEWRLLKDQLVQEQEEVRALQEKSSALEDELKSSPKTFLGNLPTKPSHVIQERHSEVSMILEQMKELRKNSDGEISTIYLSGNPGCGKSQIARMVGETFYQQVSTEDLAFVATLNAESLETLFNSYDSLSRALGCTEFAVGRITTSKDSIEEKLEQFQRLVTPKMREFSSWLIIIDNVVDLEDVRRFWPPCGSREYGYGQILVTTQDSSTIPDNGSHSHCISLSRGMDPRDAVSLLTKVSQMPNQENVEDVAKALDYQPLALACAAWYVFNVRSHGSSQFNWEKYLDKLTRGKEEAMGEVKKKCESGYTRSMPVAVRMTVERAVANDEVLFHTFQFLSICAPGPIPLEAVVHFVGKRIPDFDDEEIISKIMESSLVQISCKKDGEQTLWLHQVLYRVIRSNANVCIQPGKELEVISTALGPVQSLTVENSSTSKIFVEHLSPFLSYVISFQLSCVYFYSHLAKVTTLAEFFNCFISCASMCLKYGKTPIVKKCVELVSNLIEANFAVDETTSSLLLYFCGLALIDLNSEFPKAIQYLEMSLTIRRRIYGSKHEAVANCLHHLGRANFNFSHNEEATKVFQEALSIFREIQKEERVAECLVGLGNVKGNQCYHAEAKQYMQEALSISRELFGTKHLLVARCLHNLGVISIHFGHYDEAQRFLEEALAIQLEICGENQERVAISLTNLGRLHIKGSRYERARHFMDRALNIRCHLGNQLRVGRSLYFLGSLSEAESKISAAADYYNRALQTIRSYEFLPENHLYVREAVAALQRINETAKAQSTTTITTRNISMPRKRKAEDSVADMKLQRSRQGIQC